MNKYDLTIGIDELKKIEHGTRYRRFRMFILVGLGLIIISVVLLNWR